MDVKILKNEIKLLENQIQQLKDNIQSNIEYKNLCNYRADYIIKLQNKIHKQNIFFNKLLKINDYDLKQLLMLKQKEIFKLKNDINNLKEFRKFDKHLCDYFEIENIRLNNLCILLQNKLKKIIKLPEGWPPNYIKNSNNNLII